MNKEDLIKCAVYQGVGTGIGLFIAQLLINLVKAA